jgi:hypothetical protein
MKKIIMAALLSALCLATAFATEGDLTIPGERWNSKFTAYVCHDGNTQTNAVPAQFASRNVVFGKMTTDFSLDNYLLRATFEENGAVCNYSAILLADNAAWTIKLVESKAYSTNEAATCLEGKAALDAALNFNSYKYLHGRAALYVPATDASALCGADATTVGLHFQVTGRIQP